MWDDKVWNRRFPIAHYELSYLVEEEVALQIRDFIQSYLELDAWGVGRPDFSFPMRTVYLDSDKLDLYWQAINDSEHRCQLRIRTEPDSVHSVEIKRRASRMVLRETCQVQENAIGDILAGQFLEVNQLINRCAKDLLVVQNFIKLKESLNASPKLQVAYMRESYVSYEETARVTFDREIVCQASKSHEWSAKMDSPRPIFQGKVLLELNYRERYPDWFRELVRVFNLTECEADKFTTAMSAVEPTLHSRSANQPSTSQPFE